MGVEIALLQKLVREYLEKLVGVDVRDLLCDDELLRNVLRGRDEAEAYARRKHLREASAVNDGAVLIQRLEGRHVLPLEAKLAVGVVLEYHDAVFDGDAVNLFSSLKRERYARGVLESRDGVKKTDVFFTFHRLLEGLGDKALFVGLYADEVDVIGAKGVKGAYERRVFAKDGVPLVAKHFARKLYSLLSARDYYDVVAVRRGGEFACKTGADFLAKGRIALGDAVLKRLGRHGLEYLFRDALHIGDGKRLGGGVARGKGYHAGGRAVFEYLPNGARF